MILKLSTMKEIRFIFLIGLFFCACKTNKPIDPVKSEMDFTSSNYYTPADINKYKKSVKCDETPYWEGKTIKLQGFLFSGNINVRDKKFFVYNYNNVFDANNDAIIVHYLSRDSASISKKLIDNSDKHCLIRVMCFTKETVIEGCVRIVQFTLIKPEDLEFK